MTVDANNPTLSTPAASSKTQTTLNRFFQRYQVTSNVDSVALLRSRALQEAQRRNSSPQPQSLKDSATPDRDTQLQVSTNEGMLGSSAASATTNHSHDETTLLDPANATPKLDPVCPAAGGSTDNELSQQHDLKRKQPDDKHSDAGLISTAAETDRPAKRSRSTSVEPGPRQPTPTSSTGLSAPPPTSQLSVPSSLKSLSVILSQERPVYVPSSQSDEDSESQGDVTVHIEQENNSHDAQDASDADSESSLSSLDDLRDILQPYKGQAARDPRPRSSYYRSRPSALATSQRPQFAGKYSLSNLIKQHDRELSVEAELSRAQSVLNDGGQDADELSDVPASVDKSLLASLVNQDDRENEVHKLLHAMSRADVLNTEVAWHFFDHYSEDNEQVKPAKFPKLHGDLARYQDLFTDPLSRKSAFLTGFAREVVSEWSLPDELRDWLWNAAASEPEQDLAEAYMSTLASAKSMSLVDSTYISTLFKRLGAKTSSINLGDDITPIQESVNAPRRPPPQWLPRILRMLARLPHCISTAAKTYAIAILLRLAVDAETVQEVNIRWGLHKSLEALTSNLPQDTVNDDLLTISANLLKLTHPILQDRLLSSIPSTTPRLHRLKRRLALAFFLSSPTPLHSNLDDATAATTLAQALIRRLKTDPALHAPDSTADYRVLAASVSILDIAIDSGFGAVDVDVDGAAKSKQHDKIIDALIGHVHVLFARIVDSGATHLARTEAKAVLERVLYRLDFGVRSEPREARGALAGAATRSMYDYVSVERRASRGGGIGDDHFRVDDGDEDEDGDEEAYVTAGEENDEDEQTEGDEAGAARVSRFLARKSAAAGALGAWSDDDDDDNGK